MKTPLSQTIIPLLFGSRSTSSKSSAPLRNSRSKGKFLLNCSFGLALHLHPCVPQLRILFSQMHVLPSIIIIISPHIEDASHIKNKNPTGMPMRCQLIPQSRNRISRMRLVVIFNKRHLLQCCQILQVSNVVGQQFRRNRAGQRRQNIGHICYKFVVSQFQLFILPLLVVLFKNIVLKPLRFLRYRFIVLTLMMRFG